MHAAHVTWRADGDVASGRYSRAHEWRFDGGAVVPGSSSPSVVPEPWSRPDAVDPEEAFVAAVSSCHMLWFLDLARREGHAAAAYDDRAEGRMGALDDGRAWVEAITLRPEARWSGEAPDRATVEALHHAAHRACFIANSVRTRIDVALA